jgi:hypothetical protein
MLVYELPPSVHENGHESPGAGVILYREH